MNNLLWLWSYLETLNTGLLCCGPQFPLLHNKEIRGGTSKDFFRLSQPKTRFEQAPLNRCGASHSLRALSLCHKGLCQQRPLQGLAGSGSHWRSTSLWSPPRGLLAWERTPGLDRRLTLPFPSTSSSFQCRDFTDLSASSHTGRHPGGGCCPYLLGGGVGNTSQSGEGAFPGSHRRPSSDCWIGIELRKGFCGIG